MAERKQVTKSKSGPNSGQLVPQPHGGAIRVGSQKGNTPGTGRPPDAVRAAMRASLDSRLSVLEQIIDGTMHEPADRIRALDVLAKYGLGTKDEINLADDPRVKATIQRVAELVLEIAGADVHAQISARLAAEGL